MPSQVDSVSVAFAPRQVVGNEQRQALARASLHLHHVDERVDGADVPGVDRECAARKILRATILPVFLQPERVHREHARVAGHVAIPVRQHPGQPIAQHAPLSKAKVKRVGDDERGDVTRPVADDSAITREGQCGIAVEPGARCGRMPSGRIAVIRFRRLDHGQASRQRGTRLGIVSAHDERGAQAMAKYASRIAVEQALERGPRLAALRMHQRERVLAALPRVRPGGKQWRSLDLHIVHGDSGTSLAPSGYSGTVSPDPPISFGKSFILGRPSLIRSTVSV